VTVEACFSNNESSTEFHQHFFIDMKPLPKPSCPEWIKYGPEGGRSELARQQ